jgi:hypothetical protein
MLQSQKYPNNSRTISGAINIVRTDDVTLLCNTSSGIVGLSLQEIPDDYYSTQYKLYVVDLSANANTNNITIDAPSGHTINGASSFVINANSASVVIRIVANKTYICQYSVIGGGGGITQAYQTIQEEGSALTQRSNMNFIGTSVNAADDGANSRTNVTIQAYNTIQEEGGAALTQRDTINFIGTSVTASDDGANSRTNVTVQAYNTIQDESASSLTQRDNLLLYGSAVSSFDGLTNTKSNIGTKAFNCNIFINDVLQPTAGVIPSVAVSPNGGIADFGQTLTRYTHIISDLFVTSIAINSVGAPGIYDITFSENHNLASNVSIRLRGILGSTNANGTFTYSAGAPSTNEFQVLSSNSIRIQVSTSATAYTCGGWMYVIANNTAGNFQAAPPDCSFGSLNQTTGGFTINQNGLYLIEASIHLKADASSSVYWSTSANGVFGIGICTNNATDIFAGSYQTVLQNVTTEIDACVSCVTSVLTTAVVNVRVLNRTSRNYNGTTYPNSDVVRFSIIKLN